MSPLIFTTDPDNPYSVEIANVGVLGGSGKGGIPVERAAETLAELQGDDGKPLAGKKLEEKAREFAESRGLRTKALKSVDEDAQERLRVEAGAFPRGHTARSISEQYGQQVGQQVEAHEEAEAAAPLVPDDLPTQDTSVLPETPPSS